MYSKGIAIVALTMHGVTTSLKIKNTLTNLGLSCTVYAPKKYALENVVSLDKKLDEFIKETYGKVDALVAVMATGIVIRAVAPYLGSKLTDPAVVAVDVSGKFAVSLLSGHYGGANELTRIIAKGIGATPVITTASDVLEKQSADELARILHLSIENPESLVAVNAAIVNGDRLVVVLVGNVEIPAKLISDYEVKKAETGEAALKIVDKYDAGMIIAEEPLSIDKFVKPFTILKPRTIVVGLGARKSSSENQITEAINCALTRVSLPLERVNCLATVSIKKDSIPMVKAAKQLGLPLEFLSVEELRSLSHGELSPDSDIVKEKIGVGGVCERAALIIAGKNAHLILKKTKMSGVTVAIAEA